jgi:hypothetical protein
MELTGGVDGGSSQVLAVFLLSLVQEPSYFNLKEKAQRCLKYIDYNYLEFTEKDRTVNSSNSLQIFHHNVRGLGSTPNEFINFLELLNINPHVLCFSEHHNEEQDLLRLPLPGYILG